jgi:hypothetical protein
MFRRVIALEVSCGFTLRTSTHLYLLQITYDCAAHDGQAESD